MRVFKFIFKRLKNCAYSQGQCVFLKIKSILLHKHVIISVHTFDIIRVLCNLSISLLSLEPTLSLLALPLPAAGGKDHIASLNFCFVGVFGGTGGCTQGFVLAGQVLCFSLVFSFSFIMVSFWKSSLLLKS
jgi:hypothetical protein